MNGIMLTLYISVKTFHEVLSLFIKLFSDQYRFRRQKFNTYVSKYVSNKPFASEGSRCWISVDNPSSKYKRHFVLTILISHTVTPDIEINDR